MLTFAEIEDFAIKKLGLEIGQEITGLELWNYLIEKGMYPQLDLFFSFFINNTMSIFKEGFISPDLITRSCFHPEFERLDQREKNKILNLYKITGIKIYSNTGSSGEEIIFLNVYGCFKIGKDKNWGKGKRILFGIRLNGW